MSEKINNTTSDCLDLAKKVIPIMNNDESIQLALFFGKVLVRYSNEHLEGDDD